MTAPRALVLAKATVPGRVKTRLAVDIGDAAAAAVAAASLLDTVTACSQAFGSDACHLALHGDPADGVRGDELARATAGWTTTRQRGAGFAERLVNAHLDLPGDGAVLQVGMDTPQLTPELLGDVAEQLDRHGAVLGPAEDGGWWILALRSARDARALSGVPMSTTTTYQRTRAALVDAGLQVGVAVTLRDVDDLADARAVVTGLTDGHFPRAWREVAP
ncbi:hypothetical protein SAMN04487968_102314 [Nocardioides terrae]|uniref:Uncharacterized protein n=1 Tax=Nocardioides terrae TaxID=574651 RepID=A0A1I1F091_9ACTN|nr:DUF2064 domain-containing protein [Nocardioides terrae]SFB92406.1 hypothetical protein SAMN04487968_102314 [Nocardioides terrae]